MSGLKLKTADIEVSVTLIITVTQTLTNDMRGSHMMDLKICQKKECTIRIMCAMYPLPKSVIPVLASLPLHKYRVKQT